MVVVHRTRAGDTLFVVTTRELEGARGWHYTHGGRKGRGACVMHGGDNPTAMDADFMTGWIVCHTRGCRGRLAEHPDTRIGQRRAQPIALPRPLPPLAAAPFPADPDAAHAGLGAALAGAQARLPGSLGEGYLRERGFTLTLAQAQGLGWGVGKEMANRVIFPLTNPAGVVTSATGRDVTGRAKAKYYTLPRERYPKGWFNGRAVALAREQDVPLYLCEGPFDALALLSGGIPTAAAVLGVTGIRAEWLAGVRRVVICFDADAAGQDGRANLAFTAAAGGTDVELLPCSVLGTCKDLGAYWTTQETLPDALVDHWRASAAPTFGVGPAIITTGPCLPLPAECLAPALCTVLGRCERATAGRCCVSTCAGSASRDIGWS